MTRKRKLRPEDRGLNLLHDPELNKGTAFTEAERRELGLEGLLPPRVFTQQQQVERVLYNLQQKPSDLERYIYLISLQDRNERLFYKVLESHLREYMPIIYTPTVGMACQLFGHIYRRPRGLYLSANDKGRLRDILMNWPHRDVRVIVVTDGERILGLGDLGADGMGIPIGKLSLYTACAGIPPHQCLPVTIDVGTENTQLREDRLYLGLAQPRLRGEAYDELLDEFMHAAASAFPDVLIQLEDFATRNAFRLLNGYRDRFCLFDDDIQGTAAVAMAGIFSALRITGRSLKDQRILFLGAGEAGVGIADIITAALVSEGLEPETARQACWFVDSKGLVCRSRQDLAEHKRPYAHDVPYCDTLSAAIDAMRPTVLVGVSGQGGQFTEDIVRKMAGMNERPVVFALSNPTSKSECTAEQAYAWSGGRAIFASGSPFDPVEVAGRRYVPGQGNNVYIFPGMGLGVIYARSRAVTDAMFLEASRVLASEVSEADLAQGCVYPPFERIREVSLKIAVAVVNLAIRDGLSDLQGHEHLEESIRATMYDPDYEEFCA